jgi:hypothetical protein
VVICSDDTDEDASLEEENGVDLVDEGGDGEGGESSIVDDVLMF